MTWTEGELEVTDAKSKVSRITLLISIFLLSVSLFVYQVTLTRLYSAILSYHYVFLTTSFAILGLGIGSIFAYRMRSRNKKIGAKAKRGIVPKDNMNIKHQVNKGSIILAASYIVVFVVNYMLPFVNSTIVYILLGTIPFLVGGYLYSILFTEFSEISGKLYFADLIGSGAGSAAVILLLNNAGMLKTVIAICVISLIPALILPASGWVARSLGYAFPLVLIAGLFLPPQYINTIEKNFQGISSNPEKTIMSLQKSGMPSEIVFSKWNAFSRTDLIKLLNQPDEMVLTIDGSANAPMYEFNGDIKSLDKFKVATAYLPFAIGSNAKTLLIGAGGGKDVLYALAGGSKDISAVEINTSSIDAVKAYGAYNGNIYNRPEVKVFGEDGRNFVKSTKDKFDMIFLSLVMTNTSQGMGYALSENYIYTVEAVEDYLNHLNNNGRLVFSVHDQDDLSKIVATAIEALKSRGVPVKDAPRYLAIFTKYMPEQTGVTHVHNPVVIVKNSPFTESESQQLLDTAKKTGNDAMYTPLLFEQGVLHHLQEQHISMADYINGFSTNVTPATDDNPYFYNFEKGIPNTLPLILIVIVIGSIILFTPFVLTEGNAKPSMYFSLLGIGFMMIEVPLIQKFILYLGHPALAFTYVLAALLVGGGIGGYFSSSRFFNRQLKALYLPPFMVAIINIVLILTLGFVFQSTSNFGLTGRIIIASVLVMIQGFFMGMPFPRGLKLIGKTGKREIVPIMWGINGVASVVGSVLSVILSMTIGFTGALIAGAAVYIAVSLFRSI